jgi:hypothetical protein
MSFLSKSHVLTLSIAAALAVAPRLSADVVETRNGARIVGKITKIDAGVVYVSTDFAGDLAVKQAEVVALTTDHPVAVRLASGTRMDGPLATSNGTLQIAGQDGTITTTVAKVAASWPAGSKDPEVVALERHWKYEATVDINGTSGNHNQLGTDVGFNASLSGLHDALKFYADYNRQKTDGVKSADRFKAGTDYSDNFEDGNSWFVRDEGGFDRIMDERFFDTAAAGYGYDLVKTKADKLTARLGLAYRYVGYESPATPAISSAAGDVEIAHDLKLFKWEIGNKLSYVPAFDNFRNYTVTQDSFFQIPLAVATWKLRLGVANNYESIPPPRIQRLDTSYYTRLILDWQ